MTLSYNQSFLKIYSIFFAKKIGIDEYGNVYYSSKKKHPMNNNRKRRWVIYNGEVEASKVPQEWNAWLHHVTKGKDSRTSIWLNKHQPNQTGSIHANRFNVKRIKNKINNIYSRWKPND